MPLVKYDPELAKRPGVRQVGRKLLVPFEMAAAKAPLSPPPPAPPQHKPPGIARKMRNLTMAMAAVAKDAAKGMPVLAGSEIQDERAAICAKCDYWNPGGNLGLGLCAHTDCGCTSAKQKLLSSKCPCVPPKWLR